MTREIVSYEEFVHLISELLGVAEPALKRETNFLSDLAVESLKMMEMLLQMQDVLKIEVPSDAAWNIQTVGDAYAFYVQQAHSGESVARGVVAT